MALRFRRLAVVTPLEDGRWLAGSLPLVPEGETVALGDLKAFSFADEETERQFVLNYDKYYVISPGSFDKIEVPPPPTPMRFDDQANNNGLPRYTYDLLPCPKTLQPFPELPVCVESQFKEAVFLHPDRVRATAQERATRLEDFGAIQLAPGSEVEYEWSAWIEPEKNPLKRLLPGHRFVKKFRDRNGEFSAGPFRP